MNKFKFTMGAMALALAAVAIIACSKEKTAQQETEIGQLAIDPYNLTLAEMAETMSWDEDRAFFENQPVKDYTTVCEKVLNDCGFMVRSQGSSYSIVWRWPIVDGGCDYERLGICSGTNNDTTFRCGNAMGCFEDGKLVIIPLTDDNGFTADGYLAVGRPVVVENDSIIIREGIYVAYFDEEIGRYVAVAVDVDVAK